MAEVPRPKHVFVLMLENRSFDHLFGFSELTGFMPGTRAPTRLDGLVGNESNLHGGIRYQVARGADDVMPVDPAHEFGSVLEQLCGRGVGYRAPYPPIDRSGFVDSYVDSGGGSEPGEILECFDTERQLPVLFALAQSYAICDHWHASLPGPTVPNRLFAHGASSGGLDHSPSVAELLDWETTGLSLPNGTIFDALTRARRHFRIYSGEGFPLVATLEGISHLGIRRVDDLAGDLASSSLAPDYVFIEPSYHVLQGYRGGTSMHPLADVRDGERLVKQVYEAVRSSPHWADSLLLITWDEHGGFYDHVDPPPAPDPGDAPHSPLNRHQFTFEQYGVRVPAIVISPRIPRNTIDHRLYDHASIPRTLEDLLGLSPLTRRDAAAASLLGLLDASAPLEADTDPQDLPAPAPTAPASAEVARPDDPVDDGTLPAVVHSALRQAIARDPAGQRRHLEQVAALRTRADAHAFLEAVRTQHR